MAFAAGFKMDYGVVFFVSKRTETTQDAHVSNFVPGASFASYRRHVRITKSVLRKPLSLEYFENTAASTIGVIHVDDKSLPTCSDSDAVLVLEAASAYLLNPARSKGNFLCRPFYSAAKRLVKALHAL